MSSDTSLPKTRRRNAGKATIRQDEAKTKITLYVTDDLAKRFAVHATYTNKDRSELFAEMIQQHCRRFVVSDRQAKTGDEEAVSE